MRHAALMCAGAVLFGSLAASRGANCTAKFEGLVTCAALNGAPASGTAAQLSQTAMASLDDAVMRDYILDSDSSVSGAISKSDACREIYFKFHCARLTSMRVTSDAAAPYQFAAPCNAAPGNYTGARMLPCAAWCTEFVTVCLPLMPWNWRDDICKPWTAPGTDACFGSDGWKGMKPPPPPPAASGARSLQAPGWVGMLAVVVMHYVLN
jgi:hypothetical protein